MSTPIQHWIKLAIGTLLVLAMTGCSDEPETPEAQKTAQVSVKTQMSETGDIVNWVFAQGTARAKNREFLTFENPGRVEYVMPGQDGRELREGTRVEKGTVLARQDQRTYTAELRNTQTAVDQAETELRIARQNLERFESLYERESASRLELEEARSRVESAQAQLANAESRLEQAQVTMEETEITAPIDGVVAYINIEEGFYFTPSSIRTDSETAALQTIPMVLIDPATFEIILEVPAFEMAGIEESDRVVLRPAVSDTSAPDDITDEMPDVTDRRDAPLVGEVYSVNPAVTPGSRSVQITVRVDAPGRQLQDGMFLSAWIAAREHRDTVIVPQDALIYGNNQAYVFIIDSQGRARRTAVQPGLSSQNGQEIISGLDAGVAVITEGRFQVSDETPVRVIDAGMATESENRELAPSAAQSQG